MIRLSRAYTCVFGAPVIRSVDPKIFRLRYFTHCMSCSFCGDQCCSYGVDIDIENIERLKALGEDFVAAVAHPKSAWFTDERERDHEFPGGIQGRTATVGDACIFLDRQSRGCKIHRYCISNGIDYHLYKPIVSTLFPLTFEQGLLTVSGELDDGDLICAGEGPIVYDGVKPELEYYFGREFVAEVDSLRSAAA